jgi:hypothetical protein
VLAFSNWHLRARQLNSHSQKITSGAAHDQLSKQASDWILEAQLFVDGVVYKDATFMRCDLDHTATCC